MADSSEDASFVQDEEDGENEETTSDEEMNKETDSDESQTAQLQLQLRQEQRERAGSEASRYDVEGDVIVEEAAAWQPVAAGGRSALAEPGEQERLFRRQRKRQTARLSSQLNHAPPFYHHWLWGFRFSTARCEAAERRLLLHNLRPGTDVRSLFVPCGQRDASLRCRRKTYYMHTIHIVPPASSAQRVDSDEDGSEEGAPQPSPTTSSVAGVVEESSASVSEQHNDDNDDNDDDEEERRRRQRGRRVPLVLAHGFGGGVGIFVRQYQLLHDHGVEVYAFDWLGMGRSSKPAFELPPLRLSAAERRGLSKEELRQRRREHRCRMAEQFFCDALERWRLALGLRRFVLLGHSLGGYLAACYALRYPGAVARLVLASPVGIPPSDGSRLLPIVERLWRWEITPQQFLKGAGPFGPAVMRSVLERRGFSDWFTDEHEARLFVDYLFQITSTRTSGDKALYAILEPGAHPVLPLLDRLDRLDPAIPLHVIFGAADWMYNPRVDELRRRLPLGQFSMIRAGGDHHLYLDPFGLDAFNETLLNLVLRFH